MSNPLTDMPEGEPGVLVAGDTWTWKRSDLSSDYPAVDYVLSYKAKREGADALAVDVTATESGDTYQVTVAAATTAALVAGTYHWEAHMTRVSDNARVRVASGLWVVEANGAATGDPRSHAKKMLDAIEALMENRATGDVNSYSIAGRSLSKMTPAELQEWRNYYKREVNRERMAERARLGKATGRTTVVRFRG